MKKATTTDSNLYQVFVFNNMEPGDTLQHVGVVTLPDFIKFAEAIIKDCPEYVLERAGSVHTLTVGGSGYLAKPLVVVNHKRLLSIFDAFAEGKDIINEE